MPLKLQPGKAYKVQSVEHVGEPTIVKVGPTVAKRARYMGCMVLLRGWSCAIFKDEQTGDCFAQPVP